MVQLKLVTSVTLTGARQDAWHIFTQCPAFATIGQENFEDHHPEDLTQITDLVPTR